MRSLLPFITPCVVLPLVLFLLLAYPAITELVENRLPLLPMYFISKQLEKEIAAVEAHKRDLPPDYKNIIKDYGYLAASQRLMELAALSNSSRKPDTATRLIARVILWRRNLPTDFLEVDPVEEILANLQAAREKESQSAARRDRIVAAPLLGYLRYGAPDSEPGVSIRRGLPADVLKNPMVFCGERIPLKREDVKRRIEYQIEYLLGDLRESTLIWLKRKDRYAEALRGILEKEGVPAEFALLPALESGYDASAVSPSRAKGWWQFIKVTAETPLSTDPRLDWRLMVAPWRDERCDLALATRSAARCLTWLRSRLLGPDGNASWLTAAAAYNAGLSEVQYRVHAYGTGTYWDMKLPLETEEYVPRWIAFAIIESYRDFYGLGLPRIHPFEFDSLEGLTLKKDLPLSVVAALSDASVRFIREINGAVPKGEAHFRARANQRPVKYTVHVPRGTAPAVLEALRIRDYLEEN